MDSLRLLIVDDEPLIRAGIRANLSGMPSVRVAGECGCVAQAVEAIRSAEFDVVLLDVQMPDGAGFDVIRKVGPQHMPAVVFVTAYDKYALQAFEVNAVDYLLKPFDEARLRQSIDRVRNRLSRPAESARKMEQLIEAHSRLLATVDQQAEEARHTRAEMEIARGVQQKLFPRETKPVPGIAYAGCCAPARNVSGDYYDFLRFGEGRMGVVLADVSGKGVPAALLMANLHGSFRAYAEAGQCEPSALLRSINRLLYDSTSPETFATLFFGDYDCATHRLRYVNCGHPPPYVLREDGSVVRLEATSTVLGVFPSWRGDEGLVEFSPGDTLFAYTDGLTEAPSTNGEEFGDARLEDVLVSAHADSPEALIDKAISAVSAFQRDIQEDDMTAVALQRTPAPSEPGDTTSHHRNGMKR